MENENHVRYIILFEKAYKSLEKQIGLNSKTGTFRNYDYEGMFNGIKKIILWGVRIINSYKEPEGDVIAVEYQQLINVILYAISVLAPSEFVDIFPPDESDIKLQNPNEMIGDAIEFLWRYPNHEIKVLNFMVMKCLNYLKQQDGQPSLFEEWKNLNMEDKKITNSKKNRPDFLKVICSK